MSDEPAAVRRFRDVLLWHVAREGHAATVDVPNKGRTIGFDFDHVPDHRGACQHGEADGSAVVLSIGAHRQLSEVSALRRHAYLVQSRRHLRLSRGGQLSAGRHDPQAIPMVNDRSKATPTVPDPSRPHRRAEQQLNPCQAVVSLARMCSMTACVRPGANRISSASRLMRTLWPGGQWERRLWCSVRWCRRCR